MGRIWRESKAQQIAIAWIKAHIGIPGNELADRAARRGAGMDREMAVQPLERCPTVEEALRRRSRGNSKKAWGLGSTLRWSTRACTSYTRLRTGRGDIGSWRELIRSGEPECRKCGEREEGGEHN